jgi:hypothetical protein
MIFPSECLSQQRVDDTTAVTSAMLLNKPSIVGTQEVCLGEIAFGYNGGCNSVSL